MNYGNVGTQPYGGIGNLGGGLPATSAPQAATIQTALDFQAKTVGELHATIDQLESRLSVVLGPEPQNANEGSSTPAANQVFDRLQDHTRAVNLAMGRLHRLMQRLQL